MSEYPKQTSEWIRDTYGFTVHCRNCGRKASWRQEKGHSVPEFVPCTNCECYVRTSPLNNVVKALAVQVKP